MTAEKVFEEFETAVRTALKAGCDPDAMYASLDDLTDEADAEDDEENDE